MGCIVPSGIATDDTTKFFFQHMMDGRRLVSLYDFENRRKLFPGIDSRIKFCLLTLTGHGRPALEGSDFVFFALEVADLREEEKHFTLTPEEIALINPNTRTCPIFRTKRDAELTKAIYRRVPVLIKEGLNCSWSATLSRVKGCVRRKRATLMGSLTIIGCMRAGSAISSTIGTRPNETASCGSSHLRSSPIRTVR